MESQIVPKINPSVQMDADIGKQLEKDAKRQTKIFNKKSTGPMGVTDISKRRLRINLSPDIQKFLFLIAECLIVGFLIMIMFNNFGNFKIGLINYFGWSVLWLMIKFVLPDVIRRYR